MSAYRANNQSLQQCKAFPSRSAQAVFQPIGLIGLKAFLVGQIFFPSQISRMMIWQENLPLVLGHALAPGFDLARRVDGFDASVAAKNISSRIGRISKDAAHSLMRQKSPKKFSIPDSPIRTFWKTPLGLIEQFHHTISRASLLESIEHSPNSRLHFLIRIHNNAVLLVINKTNRQRKCQFTFLGFVQLAPLEARANEMQFGL